MESEGNEGTDRSKLESIRGFLVYVARTYRYMNPYLKGLHINMDSWSPYRDDKGWCMRGEQLNMARIYGKWEGMEEGNNTKLVRRVPRLRVICGHREYLPRTRNP